MVIDRRSKAAKTGAVKTFLALAQRAGLVLVGFIALVFLIQFFAPGVRHAEFMRMRNQVSALERQVSDLTYTLGDYTNSVRSADEGFARLAAVEAALVAMEQSRGPVQAAALELAQDQSRLLNDIVKGYADVVDELKAHKASIRAINAHLAARPAPATNTTARR
jgi:hypothetical protein